MHGYIMYAGYVPQRVKGRQLCAKAHELVQISDICKTAQMKVFFGIFVGGYLISFQKFYIYRRVKR